MSKQKKTIKAWAVIWKEKAARELGAEPFYPISLEDAERHKVPSKRFGQGYYYLDGLAIFRLKKEAEIYREKNKDFKVVPVKIIICL